MSDSQEEKIKILIRKAGYKVEDAISLLGVSKQTFYNRIRKNPIDQNTIHLFKERLKIDIENMSNELEIGSDEEMKKLREDNRILNKRIDELSRQLHEAQQEIIALLRKK